MDALVIQRAAEEWAPTPDDVAFSLVLDDAAYLREHGGRETRTLDTALRIKRDVVERVLLADQRRQLAAARATLGYGKRNLRRAINLGPSFDITATGAA